MTFTNLPQVYGRFMIFILFCLFLNGCSSDDQLFTQLIEEEIAENQITEPTSPEDSDSTTPEDQNPNPNPDTVFSDVLKAFPSAEGFGKNATGGRGGSVYKVTNLNDSGSGSLRDAISVGNRIIVFTLGGNITLSSPLIITKNNITIAGQSAPGGGISININGIDAPTIEVNASNIIIRYLRIRHSLNYTGSTSADGIHVASGQNIIIDHCSVTQASDEAIAITEYSSAITRNVTIQNCIIGEGFTGSSKGALVTGDVQGVSFYRNYFVHNNIRSPQIASDWGYPTIDRYSEVINNVVYNYKTATTLRNNQGAGRYLCNIIGNYYKLPSNGYASRRAVNIYNDYDWEQAGNPSGEIGVYVRNNIDPFRTSDDQDEWSITQGKDGVANKDVLGSTSRRSLVPYPSQIVDDKITLVDAFDLWANLSPTVGASLPRRDSADAKLINDYNTGYNRDSAYITQVFPSLERGTPYTDVDNDGMADDWERANGMDLSKDDSAGDKDGDGYTNIEEFLNLIS